MCSWSSEVRRSFATVKELAGFLDYTFIDIGCGKGKVVLLWNLLLRKAGLDQRTVGLDYYAPLIEIAQHNYYKLFQRNGEFISCDATRYNFDEFGNKLIVYLYNPFDDEILRKVVHKIKSKDVIVVYNNPVHAQVLLEYGFYLLAETKGFHVNLQTKIFHKPGAIA